MSLTTQKPPIEAGALQGRNEQAKLDVYLTPTHLDSQDTPKYYPGWLTRRVLTPPPVNAATWNQVLFMAFLIGKIGRPAFAGYKARLGIPAGLPLNRITRRGAWLLIQAITADLEASQS